MTAVWGCHIGLDKENAATRCAWEHLAPYLDAYDAAVFSAPEYIPERLARRATVIYPGIYPLAPKNRELSLRRTVEIMCNGGIIPCPAPTVGDRYLGLAQRLMPDGTFAPASIADNIGLLTRPIVTQVSRWDRPWLHADVAILLLPMHSLEEHALMVNALQRASTIVVQNSLREGFG